MNNDRHWSLRFLDDIKKEYRDHESLGTRRDDVHRDKESETEDIGETAAHPADAIQGQSQPEK